MSKVESNSPSEPVRNRRDSQLIQSLESSSDDDDDDNTQPFPPAETAIVPAPPPVPSGSSRNADDAIEQQPGQQFTNSIYAEEAKNLYVVGKKINIYKASRIDISVADAQISQIERAENWTLDATNMPSNLKIYIEDAEHVQISKGKCLFNNMETVYIFFHKHFFLLFR